MTSGIIHGRKNQKKRYGLAALRAAAVAFVIAPMAFMLYAEGQIFSAEISARGRQEHIVRAERWGRYLIEVKSAEKAAVEIADKLRGGFARDGIAGRADGRIEIFLEAGEYKIITEGPENARGDLSLTVTEYSLRSDPRTLEYLIPQRQTAADLGAAGVRAWWIFVPRDTLVYIEAMGRHLGGLAVFRGGDWLVAEASRQRPRPAAPVRGGDDEEYYGGEDMDDDTEIAPREEPDDKWPAFVNRGVPEKPLNGLRVIERLERGKHLVVAYGGGTDRYTNSDGASPLYIQWMAEHIGPARQISGTIGASGINRYIAAPQTELMIESPNPLHVEHHTILPANQEKMDLITRRELPRASTGSTGHHGIIRFGQTPGQHIISVSGAPGSGFRITPVERSTASRDYTPPAAGAYRLRTLHSGFAGDNIGASGVLVDRQESSIVAFQADTVSSAKTLHRRFNLLGNVTSFLWVENAGVYTFLPGGDAGGYDWRVKRFYVTSPRDYTEPRKTRGRSDIRLERGLHLIEFTPVDRGVATFTIINKSAGSKNVRAVDAEAARAVAAAPRQSVEFAPLNLSGNRRYTFFLNSQAPEMASIHIGAFPAPAVEPFPSITGAEAEREEQRTARVSELKLGVPQYAVMSRRGFRTYSITIDEPGIYRVETTGRLNTRLTVRDRANSFQRGEIANGIGRNALIAEYFLPGTYLVIAQAEGLSAGQMGVLFSRGDLQNGGELLDGVQRRATVEAYGAVVYDFTASEDARYTIESFGQFNERARVRLEDSNGWPVFEHGSHVPREAELRQGSYKLYSLPLIHESERATRVQSIQRPVEIIGFGPHEIRVNERVSARWVVPADGEKMSARFLFEIPAPMEVRFTLSPDFSGVLKPQIKDTVLAEINGTRRGILRTGKYEIAVTPVTPRNHVPYELSVTTNDLLAGISQNVDTVRTMRVRVGEGGVYEIFSQGRMEVSARLYASDTITEIARNGSDARDWNFFISQRLNAGTYFLRLQSDAQRLPSTTVFMRRAEDTAARAATAQDGNGDSARELRFSAAEKDEELPVTVKPGENKVVLIDNPVKTFTLFTFSMDQGRPVVGLSASRQGDMPGFIRGTAPNDMFVRYGQYIGANMSMTAAVPGDAGKIVGWNARPGGSVEGIGGRFTKREYAPERADTLRTGRTVWQAETASAKEYRIGSNDSRAVTAYLSPRTGIFYVSPDGTRDMYYGGDEGAVYMLELTGGNLFLFGGADERDAAIELETFASLPSANNAHGQTRPGDLSGNVEIIQNSPTAARKIVRVDGRAFARNRLFLSGSIESADWINQSGRMTQNVKFGDEISGETGILAVNAAPGWFKMKLCGAGGSRFALECLWGEQIIRWDAAPLIRETARPVMRGGVNWYSIELAEPAHISLNAASPATVAILTNDMVHDYREFWDVLSLDAPLAPGRYTIGVKSLTGNSLDGQPLTIRFFPIITLTEDSPIELRLMPGQTRAARFDIHRRGRIGLALTASAGTAEAVLLGRDGQIITRGARQIFKNLDPGTYHILLSTTSPHSGADIKLNLFGQNAPPAEVPEERIRQIVGGGEGQ
ncbi:MAG: hypothetical protein LBC70_03965 [Chitinispirillales bacterium]|jgi:hypothetical protein|nr:hypothetical protein [Chitinispirillales bacterium]